MLINVSVWLCVCAMWWKQDSPYGQVHGSDDEEREGVDTDHDQQEHKVQHHFEEACSENQIFYWNNENNFEVNKLEHISKLYSVNSNERMIIIVSLMNYT